jgi:immune inhibitor A
VDKILTLLGEFGNQKATHDHGSLGTISHGGTDGPLHNQIPQPNRSVDNTTIWTPDFSRNYYQNLLFNRQQFPSMANFYLEQSSGAYTVDGYVSDWVKVPYNEAAYGSNYCGDIVCTRDIARFISDQGNAWWSQLVAQKGSVSAANSFLSQFDVWDRYDYDGDGDFNEPDGYIDHFQSIHAGDGEETGGGAQGEDAIWSHRSFVNEVPFGAGGPTVGGETNAFGGTRLGNSKYWIGDYTIEPENGGVGVFAHEFGHDLGLPDEYDTNGNSATAENSTAWWTLMSQGSYGTQAQDLGTYPMHMSVWDKLVVGFLASYTVANYDASGQFSIGPAEFNTANKSQAMFVVLPDKQVTHTLWKPYAGTKQYFSGSGANLDNSMTKSVHLGSGTVTATFKAKYHIEPCWDYAYLQVSSDGGTTWTNVHTNRSTDDNTNGQNFGEGITGISGTPLACDDDLSPTPKWVNVSADLSAWKNKDVLIRFRYWTDGFTNGLGIAIDNLKITGQTKDGAESDAGWEFDGFSAIKKTYETSHFNAYVLENRQYIGYDYSLQVGPYNFDDASHENHVEKFPYQNGLLIWYWDNAFEDNNVSEHPGGGLILPIDAHPVISKFANGHQMRPRILAYDATFTTKRTQSITLHEFSTGSAGTIPSMPGNPTFDDSQSYWVKKAGSDGTYKAKWNSVKVPTWGVKIQLIYIDEHVAKFRLN